MYADIGGMDIQKQEVREAVELPLTHFELYKQVRTHNCDMAKTFRGPICSNYNYVGLFFRLVSTLPGVSLCMGPQVVVRPCWPKLWRITLQVPLLMTDV